jgi:hypothetical protein
MGIYDHYRWAIDTQRDSFILVSDRDDPMQSGQVWKFTVVEDKNNEKD